MTPFKNRFTRKMFGGANKTWVVTLEKNEEPESTPVVTKISVGSDENNMKYLAFNNESGKWVMPVKETTSAQDIPETTQDIPETTQDIPETTQDIPEPAQDDIPEPTQDIPEIAQDMPEPQSYPPSNADENAVAIKNPEHHPNPNTDSPWVTLRKNILKKKKNQIHPTPIPNTQDI